MAKSPHRMVAITTHDGKGTLKTRYAKWVPPHIKAAHRGLLHAETGTPKGKKIPLAKIEKATHSPSKAVRKRAVFAKNARDWKHGR